MQKGVAGHFIKIQGLKNKQKQRSSAAKSCPFLVKSKKKQRCSACIKPGPPCCFPSVPLSPCPPIYMSPICPLSPYSLSPYSNSLYFLPPYFLSPSCIPCSYTAPCLPVPLSLLSPLSPLSPLPLPEYGHIL